MAFDGKLAAGLTVAALLDALGDAVCITDLDHRFIAMNAAMEDAFGLPRDELFSRKGYELTTEDDREKVHEAVRALLETGRPRDVKVTGLVGRTKGRNFWISFSLIRDEKGQPKYIVSATRDISTLVEAERNLLAGNAVMEALVGTSPDGVLLVDEEGKSIFFNKRFVEMWRIPDELLTLRDDARMLRHTLEQLQDPDGFLFRVRYLYEHEEEKSEDLIEFRDGRFFERYSSPLTDRNGKYHGRVWFFRDISYRRGLERKILEAKRDWESTFDAVPDFIMIVDQHHRILRANRALADKLGMKPRDVVGRTCHECVHSSDAPPDSCALHAFLADGLPSHGLIRDSCLGEYVQFSFSALESGAEGTRTVHVLRDVSSQKRLETEIVDVAEGERNRIGMDLHDGLGQNLTGIAFLCKSLQTRLEKKGLQEAEELSRILALVEQSIDRVRGLLTGIGPAISGPNDLESALHDLARLVEDRFGVQCDLVGAGFRAVDSDAVATHIYRIAQEAVHNAVKHGQAGHITIALRETADSVFLSIGNDGKKFRTRKDAHGGRGLDIMQYRAAMIGARFSIQEGSQGGTIVSVRVPRGGGRHDQR